MNSHDKEEIRQTLAIKKKLAEPKMTYELCLERIEELEDQVWSLENVRELQQKQIENSIPKSKIEQKIEELRKTEDNCFDTFGKGIQEQIIGTLEEFLKEEK